MFAIMIAGACLGTAYGVTVDPRDREASRQFYFAEHELDSTPSIDWTGNGATCDAGTTSPAFRAAIAQRINYFRGMAGVPAEIALDGEFNRKAQQAALMMSVNNSLSHDPPSNWECYTADGDQAAGSSNLFLGVNGWDAIDGYIKDFGGDNYPVGHRRWILYPPTSAMGTGDVPANATGRQTNALWVFSFGPRPETRDEFVAWPPAGYVPYQVVYPRWSFSIPSADFSSATVTMALDSNSIQVDVAPVFNGFGDNTLVWIPLGLGNGANWPQPNADTTYHVTIDGVRIGNETRRFQYDVTVIDPAQGVVRRCDLSGDGAVDALDMGQMFASWGGTGAADLTNDGIIDAADAGICFAEWTGDGASAVASVPEPAAYCQIGMVVVAIGLFGRLSRLIRAV